MRSPQQTIHATAQWLSAWGIPIPVTNGRWPLGDVTANARRQGRVGGKETRLGPAPLPRLRGASGREKDPETSMSDKHTCRT